MIHDALTPSEGLRHAALALHALAPQDKAWLLQQLPDPQVRALAPLLEELQALGIPKDRALVQLALAGSRPLAAALEPEHALALCRSLLQETPALQSQLLSLLAAEQRTAVLAAWPADTLRPTPASLPPSWSPALQDALRQALLAQALHERKAMEARP